VDAMTKELRYSSCIESGILAGLYGCGDTHPKTQPI